MVNQGLILQVKLVYFASVREAMGTSSEQVTIPENIKTIAQLKHMLAQKNNKFKQISQVLAAVNQTIVKEDALINNNDEVALFPPVTGG